jgi:integrase
MVAGISSKNTPLLTEIPTTKYDLMIEKTLITAQNEGKARNTIKTISQKLDQLARVTDLTDPNAVKSAIADAKKKNKEPLNNSTKQKFVDVYDWFCKSNGIQWKKPHYKWDETTPIIPTTDNVTKIISGASKRYTTIFTLLVETGASGEELHRVHKDHIDTEQGIISIKGVKGHASGTYKLKPRPAEMLREYIARNPEDYPFPKPRIMGKTWLKVRDRVADHLKQPELKKIQMRNLRNYSGAKLYYSLPDPIAVMRHLRHKRLETTMHYLRAIVTNGEEEYTCKATKDNKEATQLIEIGFQYVTTTPDGYMLFRKRK